MQEEGWWCLVINTINNQRLWKQLFFGDRRMKITTTQHVRIEFDDGSVKELSEQEAKEYRSILFNVYYH